MLFDIGIVLIALVGVAAHVAGIALVGVAHVVGIALVGVALVAVIVLGVALVGSVLAVIALAVPVALVGVAVMALFDAGALVGLNAHDAVSALVCAPHVVVVIAIGLIGSGVAAGAASVLVVDFALDGVVAVAVII